jgi:4'-phosphopantetheinyl transferase
VWTAEAGGTDSPETTELFESWLSPDETRRYRRFVRKRDRELFLLAHALLRHTLSRYADADPARWRFETGEHGRPELVGPFADLDLRFNISHTPGLAAVLISDGIDAGIDIESRNGAADPAALARKVFSDAEVRSLEGLEHDALHRRFYELWTLKEAYIKARGLGLRLPLRKFAFSIDRELDIRVEFDPAIRDDGSQWQFALWQPTDRHQGALAARRGAGRDRRIVFRRGLGDVFQTPGGV